MQKSVGQESLPIFFYYFRTVTSTVGISSFFIPFRTRPAFHLLTTLLHFLRKTFFLFPFFLHFTPYFTLPSYPLLAHSPSFLPSACSSSIVSTVLLYFATTLLSVGNGSGGTGMKPKKNNTVVNFVAKHHHPPSRRDDRKTRAYNGPRERDRVFKWALARVKYRTSNYHVKMKTSSKRPVKLLGWTSDYGGRIVVYSSFYSKKKMVWFVVEQTNSREFIQFLKNIFISLYFSSPFLNSFFP